MNKFRPILLVLALVVMAAAIAGCGSDPETSAPTADATSATETAMKTDDAMKSDAAMKDEAKTAKSDKTVRSGKTSYGTIIQDGRGRSLYLFTKDTSKSKCYGDCARAWPPLIVKGTPKAKGSVKADLLGTVKRRNGKLQATYNGHPLYYYVGETKANQVLCQAVAEFGGIWYIVEPNGKAKR